MKRPLVNHKEIVLEIKFIVGGLISVVRHEGATLGLYFFLLKDAVCLYGDREEKNENKIKKKRERKITGYFLKNNCGVLIGTPMLQT